MVRGWRPPKINTTGEPGLGRAGGTSLGLFSPLRLLPSTLRSSLTFKSCCIPMPFNTQIHKYTNTQMLCCNVNFYIVFVRLSCISCTFDLLSFDPFGIFVFLEIRPKRQHSSQSTDFVLLWLFHYFLSRFSTVPAFPFCF